MDQMAPLYNGSQSQNLAHIQTHSWSRSRSRSQSQSEAAKAPNKRKRIAHACEACRQRKSRCDGSRPTCGFCGEQGMRCYYRDAAHYHSSAHQHTLASTPAPVPAPAPAPGSDGQSLARLEGRLRDMESILQSLIPSRSIVLTPTSSGSQGNANVNANTNAQDESPPAHRSHDSVDGMCSIIFADDTSSGIFGPTSNSAFLQTIVCAQNLAVGHGENHSSRSAHFNAAVSRPASPPPRVGSDGQRRNPTATPTMVNPYVLPPHHEILRLIDVFFENTGRTWPYLYKPRVLRNLSNMQQTAFQNVEPSHLCLLNLLMAFAKTHCPSQTPVIVKMDQGNVFLQRALALMHNIKPAAGNLESIQALLLATQYLQGTQRSSQTWEMLGTLVHACFQVGLYQQATAIVDCSPLETELRKRTWWMCFIIDRLCSMTYGRPQLLPNNYMTNDLPLNIDLSTLASGSSGEVGDSRILVPSLFLYTSKLYIVLGSVIEKVYEHNISRPANAVPLHCLLTRVLEVEHELSTWMQEVPATLAPVTASELDDLSCVTDPQTFRFRVILTLRFLHVRILLHRSLLSRLLEARRPELKPVERGLLLSMSACSVDIGVEAAVELITLISRTTQRQDLLPIWWYSSYFSFSSALVIYGTIVALQKCEVPSQRYHATELVQHLQMAWDVLGKVGGETWQVVRCRKIVGCLLQAARTLCPQPQQPVTLQIGEGMRQEYSETALPSAEKYPAFDFVSGMAPDFQFELGSFTDVDLSSLFPDGF